MTVRICNTEVDIIFCDASLWNRDAMGRSQIKEAKILIDDTMPELTRDHTIVHELIHHIGDLLGLELTEAQVCGLSVGIHGMILDNPQLVKMLTAV